MDENLLNDEQEQEKPRFEKRYFEAKPTFALNVVPSSAGRAYDVYTLGFNREFGYGLYHLLSEYAKNNQMTKAHFGFLMQLRNCLNYRTPEEPIRCNKCGKNYAACKSHCPMCFQK